jgi:transcriptional regulator with XRE-family HTH domain
MKMGARLRNIRNEKRISLRQMAKTTGLDVGYLSRIETGKLLPAKNDSFYNIVGKALNLTDKEQLEIRHMGDLEIGKIPTDIQLKDCDMEYIPILLRTIHNKQLNEDQYRQLTEFIKEKL